MTPNPQTVADVIEGLKAKKAAEQAEVDRQIAAVRLAQEKRAAERQAVEEAARAALEQQAANQRAATEAEEKARTLRLWVASGGDPATFEERWPAMHAAEIERRMAAAREEQRRNYASFLRNT